MKSQGQSCWQIRWGGCPPQAVGTAQLARDRQQNAAELVILKDLYDSMILICDIAPSVRADKYPWAFRVMLALGVRHCSSDARVAFSLQPQESCRQTA